jgi:hypothetical protein
MGYIICDKCGGYYELQDGESSEDFDRCQCGGKLKYYETMQDFTNFDPYKDKHVEHNKEELNYELGFYQAMHQGESECKHHQYEINKDKFFSSNFIINSGFILLTFTIIPLYYGFVYYNWIFYLMAGITIFLSITLFFLNNMEYEFRNNFFQKMFIAAGIIFGLASLNLLTLLGNTEFLHSLLGHAPYNRGGSIIAYVASICISCYFCFVFLKNSRMEEQIDLLNPVDKMELYFGYYLLIFIFFIVMIGGMIVAIWLK